MDGVSDPHPRPRHTTMAAAIVMGGAVGVVVAVAEQLAGLQSLETREQVSSFLSEPPGSDLGLGVATALEALRVVLMVLAGLATIAGVLGWHAMRGSSRARLGLAVLAGPIFVGGFAVGGFLTSLVAAGSLLLFVGQSALWFRGEPIPQPAPRDDARPPSPIRRPAVSPREGTTLQAERPAPVAGDVRPGSDPVTRRPDTVVWACVLTWAFCSMATVVMLASAVLMTSDPELVADELRRQDPELASTDITAITDAVFATAAVVALWSLLAVVLAVLVYRGAAWARGALLASAAIAGVICLVGAVYSLLMAVPAGACLTTVALLSRPEVRAWFQHGSSRP